MAKASIAADILVKFEDLLYDGGQNETVLGNHLPGGIWRTERKPDGGFLSTDEGAYGVLKIFSDVDTGMTRSTEYFETVIALRIYDARDSDVEEAMRVLGAIISGFGPMNIQNGGRIMYIRSTGDPPQDPAEKEVANYAGTWEIGRSRPRLDV